MREESVMFHRPQLVRSLLSSVMLIASMAVPSTARSGFEAPPGGLPTTVKDMPYIFLGQTDYRPPGTGIISFGGVLNWDPGGTEAPMGGGKFQIDVTGTHTARPDGEIANGPQMRLSFMDVVAGGAAKGPEITSADHGSHKDWMQILLNPIEAGRSRLYVRLDHILDGSTPPTIDPAMFAVDIPGIPEPETWLLFTLGIGLVVTGASLQRRSLG
jgi:hypothetical protein